MDFNFTQHSFAESNPQQGPSEHSVPCRAGCCTTSPCAMLCCSVASAVCLLLGKLCRTQEFNVKGKTGIALSTAQQNGYERGCSSKLSLSNYMGALFHAVIRLAIEEKTACSAHVL